MILALDFSSETPIYLQIRNQILLAIAEGTLNHGDKLPTIRALANESGINAMTVNKAYQLLKQEGIISIDRRSGTKVSLPYDSKAETLAKLTKELKLLLSEAKVKGISETEMLELFNRISKEMEGTR
ncbi:MAG TPA: GntR family transcriptional regulator [Oscillospiraceae bacterium]|nr:GntR family transcriptional regulator [Oscillospiraceae bacterium]